MKKGGKILSLGIGKNFHQGSEKTLIRDRRWKLVNQDLFKFLHLLQITRFKKSQLKPITKFKSCKLKNSANKAFELSLFPIYLNRNWAVQKSNLQRKGGFNCVISLLEKEDSGAILISWWCIKETLHVFTFNLCAS